MTRLPLKPPTSSNRVQPFYIDSSSDIPLSLLRKNERAAQIVELRYFGGYEETEIAQMLGLSERTVRRDWRKARAFLLAEMRN